MPVVELDIHGTPTRVQVGDGYTPDDLDHIASTLSGSGESAASRAGSYLTHKGSEFVGALQGVGKDIENVVTGKPYGTGFPGERSGWDTAGDVATTAAPIVAPELTAAGLGVGTAGRAAGADEQTADLANAGTQLVGVGAQAIWGGFKAAGGLKAAIQARYGQVAEDAAKAGKTLTMGTKAGDEFAQALSEGLDSAMTHPVEKAMGNKLLAQMTAPGSPGVDYAALDDALAGLRKVRGQSYVRGLVNDAAQSLLEGTPAGKARLAAQASYRGLRGKAILRGGGGLLTRGGAALYGAKELQQGNYGRGAAGLGAAVVGGMSPGALMAFGKGAAGPLARTAVAVGGQIPSLDAGQGAQDAPAERTEPDTAPAAPDEGQSPSQAVKPLPGPYGREIAAVASLAGVPPELIQSHMKVESGGNAGAIGDSGRSIGLMQIQPGTAAVVGQHAASLLGRAPDLKNPLDNLLIGGLLLRRYLDQTHGDVDAAAQKYNGGEHTSGNPMTRVYAGKIIQNFQGGG